MKKSLFVLMLCFLAFSYQSIAAEKFSITWQTHEEINVMAVFATPDEMFTVEWGDGVEETYFGEWDFVLLVYEYAEPGEYTVTVTAQSEECQFFIIQGMMGVITKVDISECPSVDNLSITESLITEIDLSNNPDLRVLSLFFNPFLESLDVSANLVLEKLFINNTAISSIDLSANSLLTYLIISDLMMTEIDLSANPQLFYLMCENNKLSNLDLSNNNIMLIDCYNNHLPLSNLYEISELVENPSNKRLGTQTLPEIKVDIDVEVDFSAEAVLGGVNTEFVVLKDGVQAQLDVDYTINNGVFIFAVEGTYTVTMTNDAIVSENDFPAEVIVDIIVENGNGICRKNTMTYSVYPNPTQDIIYIKTETGIIPLVTLFSPDGKILQSLYTTELDMTKYAKGIYFLQISENETIKLVKR